MYKKVVRKSAGSERTPTKSLSDFKEGITVILTLILQLARINKY